MGLLMDKIKQKVKSIKEGRKASNNPGGNTTTNTTTDTTTIATTTNTATNTNTDTSNNTTSNTANNTGGITTISTGGITLHYDPVLSNYDPDERLKALARHLRNNNLTFFKCLLVGQPVEPMINRSEKDDEHSLTVQATVDQRTQSGNLTGEDKDNMALSYGGKWILEHIFSRPGRLEFAKALRARLWDMNRRVGNGATPLYYAMGCIDNVRWLLENGANPNVPGFADSRIDLLTHAVLTCNPALPVVELLLKKDARVEGTLALHAAAQRSAKLVSKNKWVDDHDKLEVMRRLLDAKADVNYMEPNPVEDNSFENTGRWEHWTGTPLHRAVCWGSPAAVRCLLEWGGDLSLKSWSGFPADKVAEARNRQDILNAIAHFEESKANEEDQQ